MERDECIAEVLEHFLDDAGAAAVEPLGNGLINTTYLVRHGRRRLVLQRVNAIFDPRIHENIHAVTAHLVACGLVTPTLIAARQGDHPFWCAHSDGTVWRLMTFVDGMSIDAIDHPARALAAGELVGRYHRALESLEHRFVGARSGVHDTQAHLDTLARALQEHSGHRLYEQVAPLAHQLRASADAIEPLPTLGDIVGHGDLKLNNLLFSKESAAGLCLIDLDTVGPVQLAHELGDALRSWCNRSGEDVVPAQLDLDVHEQAWSGYLTGRQRAVDAVEQRAVLLGLEWITIELATRFLADSLNESYFGFDRERFTRSGEHNLLRARSQWSLHQAVMASRSARERLLRSCTPNSRKKSARP